MFVKKLKPKPTEQTMASLLKNRVTEAWPFDIRGIDFAGPLYVKSASVLFFSVSNFLLALKVNCKKRPV